MTDKVVDLSVSIKREIPVSQGFWYDLGEGNEEKFLNLIDDNERLHSAELSTCFKMKYWGDYTKKAEK